MSRLLLSIETWPSAARSFGTDLGFPFDISYLVSLAEDAQVIEVRHR